MDIAFNIERLTNQDLEFAYDVHVVCEPEDSLDWDAFHDLCVQRDVFGIVAKVNEDVVGYLIYIVDLAESTIDIAWAGVVDCFRRLSIGTAMINWLKLNTTQKRINCPIEETNDAAYQLLRDHKFKCVRFMQDCDFNNWLVMRFNHEPLVKLSPAVRFKFIAS